MKSLTSSSFQSSRKARAAILVGILAIFGLIPASLLSQENPVRIETDPKATSTAVGEITVTEPDPVPAAGDSSEAVSEVIVEVEPVATAAARTDGATSSAISLVLTDGEDVSVNEAGERIVLAVERDDPLVKVDEKSREFPAVEKRNGRIYLVLPSSGQSGDSLNLTTPGSNEPVAESEPVETP